MGAKRKFKQKVWTHHPRGGFVTGYAGRAYRLPVYGVHRNIAPRPEDAEAGMGFSAPDSQIYLGDLPQQEGAIHE